MRLLEKVIGLVAPHNCIVCSREGELLCDWCIPDAVTLLPDRCYYCKQISDNSAVCKSCRQKGSRLSNVWVRTGYEGTAKQLVYQLKFNRAKAAARPIARLIDETLPWLEPDTVLVPVPTATSRRRSRGYDHAELIAKELASIRNLSCQPLLVRIGQSRQVGAGRKERLLQLQSAFIAREMGAFKNVPLVLIDDIVTTGGTVEAAARALKTAGAKHVCAAVFAQKQ